MGDFAAKELAKGFFYRLAEEVVRVVDAMGRRGNSQQRMDIVHRECALHQANHGKHGNVVRGIALGLRRGDNALLHIVVHHGGREQLFVGRHERAHLRIYIGEQLVHIQVDCGNVGIARQAQLANKFDVFRLAECFDMFCFACHGRKRSMLHAPARVLETLPLRSVQSNSILLDTVLPHT